MISREDAQSILPYKWHAVRCGSGKLYARRAVEAAFAVNQHLDTLDGSVGVRNAIDYDELIRVLVQRRDAIQAQIAVVERARV